MHEFRCDVFSAEQLRELVEAPLPLDLEASAPTRQLFRDLYLDTADDTLRRRGVTCRVRLGVDDRRTLSLRIAPSANGPGAPNAQRFDARVHAAEPHAALAENTSPARRLRALVDPALLRIRLEIEVERHVRLVGRDWLRRPCLEVHYDHMTVRKGTTSRAFHELRVRHRRGQGDHVEQLARAFQRQGLRVLTEERRERAELLAKWMGNAAGMGDGGNDSWVSSDALPSNALARPELPLPLSGLGRSAAVAFPAPLDAELSLLAFQERVLTLAEDARTPLRERLRFLSIVSANIDEFFSVRVAAIKLDVARAHEEQLARIRARVCTLADRQAVALRSCLGALAAEGVPLLAWHELDAVQREELRARFRDEVYPALTPLAMTLSPGHPFPRVAHLALSLALVLPDERGGTPHFADIELPRACPRFFGVTGGGVVALEEVLRANLDLLYPEARSEDAFCFRVTRAGDLGLDEDGADDLLEAVDAATQRRPHNAVVRVEVQRRMPAVLRALILDELASERRGTPETGQTPTVPLSAEDVYDVDGLLDLRALNELPLPARDDLSYPPFEGRAPVPAGQTMVDAVRERDRLFHHPFDDFEETVGRFFREAAIDPAVVALKATLYRIGDASSVVEALLEAARRGKDVAAFVELKARFDEARNVAWARALEEAGGRVIYGFVGLKNHAKVALAVRREPGIFGVDRPLLRRYVHVGTGNYNATSAKQYTDLSLLTADDALAADVADLFNELTGSSRPPRSLRHGALVAPGQLLPTLLEYIEREAAHARAGGPARIRLKLNGLSDGDIARALYLAAADGVEIELIIRGICTLRPGVPFLSERIRVVAGVGRFLEHSRVFAFANGGDPAYFIGSPDLRPRNLRHRVELLVPVRDVDARARLERLLDSYMADPTAWELAEDGSYARRRGDGPSAQELMMRDPP
jgi:polyphosphate kinase